MADSNFRGPVNSMGSLELQAGTTGTIEPLDGPGLIYQGNAMPDPRSFFNKDVVRPGQTPGFLFAADFWACDQIPQANTTVSLAAAQSVNTTGAIALVTAQVAGVAGAANVAVGVPIIPIGTTTLTTAALAIDFGFATGTTAANSTAVAVVDNRVFRLGQWIVIGGAGNSSASRSHIAQVLAIGTTATGVVANVLTAAQVGTIYISPAAVTAIANAPIGQANLMGDNLLAIGTQFGPSTASANAHSFAGSFDAGFGRYINPRETLARTVAVTLNSAAVYSCLVSGWDVWGNPMTEVVGTTSATVHVGKKAFKYISSITSGTAIGQTASFGFSDIFGYPFRIDNVEQASIWWNGSAQTNANGFVRGVSPPPATSTSADVRGVIAISTAAFTGSGIGTAISAVATNGTGRLCIMQSVGVFNQLATPNNTVPLFGVAQSTAST